MEDGGRQPTHPFAAVLPSDGEHPPARLGLRHLFPCAILQPHSPPRLLPLYCGSPGLPAPSPTLPQVLAGVGLRAGGQLAGEPWIAGAAVCSRGKLGAGVAGTQAPGRKSTGKAPPPSWETLRRSGEVRRPFGSPPRKRDRRVPGPWRGAPQQRVGSLAFSPAGTQHLALWGNGVPRGGAGC